MRRFQWLSESYRLLENSSIKDSMFISIKKKTEKKKPAVSIFLNLNIISCNGYTEAMRFLYTYNFNLFCLNFNFIKKEKKRKGKTHKHKMLWCAACFYWRNGIPAVHNVFFYIYALLHFCIWAILSMHCASEYMKTNMFIHKQRFFFLTFWDSKVIYVSLELNSGGQSHFLGVKLFEY